jgi:formylglycine-generating enzyme required for sulfatase activity
MSGNVWEWCYDWYGGLPAENAMGARKGSSRVRRGGGWTFTAEYCRAAYRLYNTPTLRISGIGFRLALQ